MLYHGLHGRIIMTDSIWYVRPTTNQLSNEDKIVFDIIILSLLSSHYGTVVGVALTDNIIVVILRESYFLSGFHSLHYYFRLVENPTKIIVILYIGLTILMI